MNIPMHRFQYTKLTKDQIGKALKVTEKGPECKSEFSDKLEGKSLKIILKNGPELSYKFKGTNKLTLSIDGGKKISAGYGALDLRQMVFFSHMVPGAQGGYNVYIDQDTNLVTVIEVGLSTGREEPTLGGDPIVVDNREVQRQIYFGYVDSGQNAPEELHHFTNRIEGKGMYWEQDTGHEMIEYYASVANTNFVDLTRQADDLSYVAPSDYVLVNDNMFIHDKTECEFSGIFTSFVADLFTCTQVGVRLGFNEKDELEYYMFRGEGKVVGQLAYLEPFADQGKVPMNYQAAGDPEIPGKWQRMTYRPARTFKKMTDEEVHAAAEKNTIKFGGTEGAAPQMMAINNMPYSDILVGKEFTLRYDNGGPVWHYRFKDKNNLEYREHGKSKWNAEPYRAYEGDDNLAWFAHILTDSKPRAAVKIAIDFTNGLTTCIYSHMGTDYYGNETTYRALFGICEMDGLEPPGYVRHEFTDDLVGHAFSWSYSDQMTSMHLYASPHSISWTIFTENQTMGAQWCSPCLFVKLREGVYIFCQNEEACNGAEMIELINTNLSHDCGFGFSGGAQGVNLGVVGAIGRHIGSFDVKEYFGPKKRKGV